MLSPEPVPNAFADIGGIAAHLGRVTTEARPSEILAARAFVDLVVGSGIDFN
jgi:hypothetical protein